MNKPIIFLGPSLTHEKARKILDAEYKPPAKKGDFLKFATQTNVLTVVGLVDGYFLQDYPPSPIEVYQLIMRKNTVVIGSASLGALRAVELEKFGMIGVGKIFELYKRGTINADDEVAVTFTQEAQSLQSEAMIDIRFNLFMAERKGIIDKITKKTVARVAKSVYFPYRNYGDILDKTKNMHPELEDDLESFRAYIDRNRQSLKERDAIRLVEYIKTHYDYE
ncbi:MAG TPA: TfuA-like protein [Nitrososphaeraceae archaeon]|nr:TfuA-like protein [Nitrososphaeraceae archaeon]